MTTATQLSLTERTAAEILDYLTASHLPGTTQLYGFCFECERVEIFDGSMSDFAGKLQKIGWVGCSCKAGEILCGECRDKQPVSNEYWAAMDREYGEWKSREGR